MTRLTASSSAWLLTGFLGLGAGLAAALPLRRVPPEACPPPGEGRGLCVLQKSWGAAAVEVLAVLGLVLLVALLVARLAGRLRRPVRTPALPEGWREGPLVRRPADEDLALLAACRGNPPVRRAAAAPPTTRPGAG